MNDSLELDVEIKEHEAIFLPAEIEYKCKVKYSSHFNRFYIRYNNTILNINNNLLRFFNSPLYSLPNNKAHEPFTPSAQLTEVRSDLVYDFWTPIKPKDTIIVFINRKTLEITYVMLNG